MNSPHDLRTHDDHLRHLLDQRAARADIHGRFPSLSECSDSPSVYSPAHFSPRPLDRPQLDTNLRSFHLPPSPQYHHPPSEPRSPMSDRERLNFPNASSLDLDDDPRSSNEFSVSNDDDDLSPNDEEEEEELPRVSVYGPKMRFHSRAPWELEDDIGEQEEPDSSGSKRSRNNKGDAGKKGWGLPKGISEKRPSTDSSRSQGKGKQSFDTMSSFSNNGGALFALAQASMSQSSLAVQPSPQHTLRDKLSLPRLRSRTPSNPKPNSTASLEPVDRVPPFPSQSTNNSPLSRFPRTTSPIDMSPIERAFSSHSSTRAPTPNTQHADYSHPYANPDHARRVTLENSQQMIPPQQTLSAVYSQHPSPVGRSDSTATLTETTTSSSMFQSQSNTTMSITPASSVNVVVGDSPPPGRSGGLYNKGISAPLLMKKGSISSLRSMMPGAAPGPGLHDVGNTHARNRETRLLSGMSSSAFPGWGEIPASPSIKLISLEEAQAQARERSRSATAHGAVSTSGQPRVQSQNSEFDQQGQVRVRSTSAGGVKAKNTSGGAMMDLNQRLPPLPAESPLQTTFPAMGGGAPPRTVIRKKSGFMRLFKDRERPQQNTPPPMPQLTAESYTSAFSGSFTPQPHGTRKGSTHRVPVPLLSPSMLGEPRVNIESGSFSDSRSDVSASGAIRERQLSARRHAPDLSIVTSTANPPSSASDHSPQGRSTTPTTGNAVSSISGTHAPNSAPPGTKDFVALSLRPVSTLFSTNFADQLISPGSSLADSRPSLETDLGTPTTATTALTPLSPDFQLRTYAPPGEGKMSPDGIAREDQSAIIQALQEQIMTARRAWQRQIWELEGQVRDLKAEVEELRVADSESPYCAACGRGAVGRPCPDGSCPEDLKKAGVKVGVVDRPRARTGIGSRFASGT
ncbi:hypothetical protein B0H21DRAFT_690921 [Amylocystis lapponica]|nr:hypothetical protein B0H21DRAFT_690921 [Amylocystis lapponica]